MYKLDVDISQVEKMYSKEKARAKKATAQMTKAMARQVPRMVGKRVSERYNIAASEIYPPAFKVKTDRKTGEKIQIKKASSVKVKGNTLENLTFEWNSRRLTVQRFKMTPKNIPTTANKKPYTISFSILRGKQTVLNSSDRRYFVQNIKGVIQAVSAKNGNRKIDRIEKTLSVPIMIDNKSVNDNIRRDINEAMLKEIEKAYK